MHEELATETLRSGEAMRVERVAAPDAEREKQILPFLGHKPGGYRAHIEASFAGKCDELETRYYVGLTDDAGMVGNIMTVESGGVGILGHVHTREDQRRKGICNAIMAHQMEDFRQRGGHVLMLGTGYQSPPYRIYESFGFRDLPGASPGVMWYRSEGDGTDFLARFFAPGASVRAVPMRWKHWPLVALLAAQPSDVYLRSLTLNAWGVSLLEGPFCYYMSEWGENPRAAATVLESGTGAVTGVATRVPRKHWPDSLLLDVFAHPNANPADIAALIGSLPAPEQTRKVVCHADPRDTAKIAALEQAGFTREAVLINQFREGNQWRDAYLYAQVSAGKGNEQ